MIVKGSPFLGHCAPNNITLDVQHYLGQADFLSRDNQPAYCQSWIEWSTALHGWRSRVLVFQQSGGFTTDTGWIDGLGGTTVANQARACLMPPTGCGFISVFADAQTPVTHCKGNQGGTEHWARRCFDDITLNGTWNFSAQPWGYTSCVG